VTAHAASARLALGERGAPVGVGAGQDVHPRLAALAAGALELEGGHVDQHARVPVVRAAHHGDVLRARPRLPRAHGPGMHDAGPA